LAKPQRGIFPKGQLARSPAGPRRPGGFVTRPGHETGRAAHGKSAAGLVIACGHRSPAGDEPAMPIPRMPAALRADLPRRHWRAGALAPGPGIL